MHKLAEFLQNDDGGLSMTRLLMLLSWPPATIIMFHIQTEGALGLYLAAYVGGYAGGKFADKTRPKSD